MVIELRDENEDKDKFIYLRADLLDLSREILKEEWDRVKKPIQTGEAAKIKKFWWHR